MSIVEYHGGTITHRYLMNKSKTDLANMYLELLRIRNRDLQVACNLRDVLLDAGGFEDVPLVSLALDYLPDRADA